MKIKFVKGLKVQQHDGKGPEYKAGEVYEFVGFVPLTYAEKYIKRGYAIEYSEPRHVEPKKVELVVPVVEKVPGPGGIADGLKVKPAVYTKPASKFKGL